MINALSGMLSALSLAASGAMTQVGLPLSDDPDPYAQAVNRMVQSIVLYTSWPNDARDIAVCVVGPGDHVEQLAPAILRDGRRIRLAGSHTVDSTLRGCDVVYLGRISVEQQRAVTDGLRGQAVLTVAENDPACRGRAMICLLFGEDSLSFRLNIDSVSRSGVRVDPRVLRMGLGDSR